MIRDVVHVQEKQGDSFEYFAFDLTYAEFYKGVIERAKPGTTMICGSFGYGDMLMLTPTLRALKELLPENPVHLYCGPKEYCIVENNPNIDLLVTVPPQFTSRSPVRTFEHLCTAYDRSFCLCGIIVWNPEAELVNAYEVMAKKIGVRPSSLIPEYYPLPVEIELARQTLKTIGITPGKDRIAVIQPRSSSILRTLPNETTEALLCRLEKKGWKTIVFWDNTNLPEKASRFGYWTSRDFRHLTLRELFAMVGFADIVIATDSAISHLAAAMNIPSVLLYGPIDSALRSSHFHKAYSLQASVTCGPCFQHGSRCAIAKTGIPPCMRWFSAESILNAVDSVLSPSYHIAKQKISDFKLELKEMKCRMCGCEAMTFYVRKKDTLYFRCIKCKTVQTCMPCDKQNIFTSPKHAVFECQDKISVRHTPQALTAFLPTIRKLIHVDSHRPLLLDVGNSETTIGKILGTLDCKVELFGTDMSLSRQPLTKHITRYVDFEQLALARTKEYDVITMLDFLQFLRAMDVMFPKVVSCLKTNGLLVLTLFSAEDIIILSHTPVIETRNSKEISLIP